DTAVERRLDTAERLFGAARTRAYSRLEHDIATRAAPWAPLATLEWDSLFSERVGCQVLHPIYFVDLDALCLRSPNRLIRECPTLCVGMTKKERHVYEGQDRDGSDR